MFGPFAVAINGGQVYYRFSRLQTMTEWWHWMLLALVTLAIVTYVVMVYRRDADELGRGLRWLLFLLRLGAFVGLLVFFLDLEKRSERRIVKDSRVLVLADTSQSMALPDAESGSGQEVSRIDRVVEVIQRGPLLDRLREQHDVVVYQFDAGAVPTEIASLPKRGPTTSLDPIAERDSSLHLARLASIVALIAFGVTLVSGIVFVARRGTRGSDAAEKSSWSLLVAVMSAIFGLVLVAVVSVRFPGVSLAALVGKTPLSDGATTAVEDSPTSAPAKETPLAWNEQLRARGLETRLGDALRYAINKERGGPIAGIVVFTDGVQNAGTNPLDAIQAARQAEIPIYTVGLGSSQRPINVRVVDLEAPHRAYPGDRFTVNGYLQAYGLAGRTVTVELRSAPKTETDLPAAGKLEESRRVKLSADGETQVIRFEVLPESQGEREYVVRVQAPEQDFEPRDNEKRALVQVIERRSRVLLFAGGPSRDFQFLRNMLFRDRDTEVDVLLQSGKPGISQEADELLYEFPSKADDLFSYDCIVAFDPDWTALDENQVELLERLVADQAGGLVVLAGAVETPQWASRVRTDQKLETIQALYPVVFYSRGAATLSLGRFGSSSAWPIQFTREGQEAEFLWLEDDALRNEQAWSDFPGIYGYYAVKDVKPGARVYARFADPETSLDGDLPVYMAGHFYGAGRVFFMASGEMWRLRGVSDKHFDTFYTKLIRWASQGRLLRDSSRGVLLVDKERCLLGDQVEVRAVLNDLQHQPLQDEQVAVSVRHEDGSRTSLILRKLQQSARGGMFTGQFAAQKMGDYRIELKPPLGGEDELLVRQVRVLAPQLETERPERNDALLKEIAEKTGGEYFVGVQAALGAGRAPLASQIEPQEQISYLPGTPDRNFERRLMGWLMGLVCGVLCLEWLVRRLNRLA